VRSAAVPRLPTRFHTHRGYYAAVSPDGSLELWKQAGAERRRLAAAPPQRADRAAPVVRRIRLRPFVEAPEAVPQR
jgi:hypothetical protein